MATGVPAIDALFAAGRGVFAVPEAIRQEGARGVFTGFLNPKPYEQASTARDISENKAADIEALKTAIDNATDESDFAPLVGQFMRLQGELHTTGATSNEQAYNQVLGPVMESIRAKAREIGLVPGQGSMDEGTQAESAIRLGTITGDPGLSRAGQSLKDVFRSRTMNDQTQALIQRYGAQAEAEPGKRELTAAETQRALAEANKANRTPAPGGPKLADLDRLRKQIDDSTRNRITGEQDTEATPNASLIEEYNRRADELRKPRLIWVPGRGLDEQPAAVGRVAETLGQAARQPSGAAAPSTGAPAPAPAPPAPGGGGGFTAQPYVPDVQNGPPAQTEGAAMARPERITVPPAFIERARTGQLRTSELVAYYQQQGLSQADAIQKARAAAWELSGAAGRR